MTMHLWQTLQSSLNPAPWTWWFSLGWDGTRVVARARPQNLFQANSLEFGLSIRWQPKGQNRPQTSADLFSCLLPGYF